MKRVTVSCATLLERVRGEVAKRKNVKKKPIVEMGKDYTQQFVVSLRGFPCL